VSKLQFYITLFHSRN